MNLARSAVRIVTHLRSPCQCLVLVTRTPYRNVSTAKDGHRLGLFDSEPPGDKLTHPLDRFLGTWDETYTAKKVHIANCFGFHKKQKDTMTWIRYVRSGDTWTFSSGYQCQFPTIEYSFKLNRVANVQLEGVPHQILVTVEGDQLKEEQQKYHRPDITMLITRKVKDDKMTVTYHLKNEQAFIKYKRRGLK